MTKEEMLEKIYKMAQNEVLEKVLKDLKTILLEKATKLQKLKNNSEDDFDIMCYRAEQSGVIKSLIEVEKYIEFNQRLTK